MSDDWNVGDLAVCVNDGPCGCRKCMGAEPIGLEAGHIYRVEGLQIVMGRLALDIGLPPCRNHNTDLGRMCFAHRFRKIRPDAHEDCEPEFVTLLKRTKVTANA